MNSDQTIAELEAKLKAINEGKALIEEQIKTERLKKEASLRRKKRTSDLMLVSQMLDFTLRVESDEKVIKRGLNVIDKLRDIIESIS